MVDIPIEFSAMNAPMHETDFFLLRADNLRLLFPCKQILAIEHINDRLFVFEGTEGMGLFCVDNGQNGYVYMALSEQIRILTEPPLNRPIVTRIQSSDGGEVRWCWNEMQRLGRDAICFQAMPPVLMTPTSPVNHFAEIDGHIAFLGDTNRLLSYALAHAGGNV